jgi:NADH dehydrogenase [ubiquinone] 1 alpha subcomplex assembly factor 7
MTPVGETIKALIAIQGPISIAEFMTIALHDPSGGYYATRDPFGAQGDFVTAPEISQMFGELIGLWIGQTWMDQGAPAWPLLVELGPGRGALMRDALRALKLVPKLRSGLEAVLIEASPVLRRQQQETLADSGVTVQWADSFEAVAKDRPLFLIANEFFDALPIRQYVKTERGWCERMVTLDEAGALAFALSPVAVAEGRLPADRLHAPLGGFYETSPASEALTEDIADRVARLGGAALIVDYGYDAPGFGETLQAMARHKFTNVLSAPGACDLSAHVDFAALAAAASRGGARACGPVGQGAFLTALGIAQRAEKLNAQAARDRLTAPEQMGSLFKALAIVPDTAPTPAGF